MNDPIGPKSTTFPESDVHDLAMDECNKHHFWWRKEMKGEYQVGLVFKYS